MIVAVIVVGVDVLGTLVVVVTVTVGVIVVAVAISVRGAYQSLSCARGTLETASK